MQATSLPLAGKTIAVTRPEGQADDLLGQIGRAGGVPLGVPLYGIAPVDPGTGGQARILPAGEALAIFVSPNAVRFGWPVWRELCHPAVRPEILAPGPGTARVLRAQGAEMVRFPAERHDADALLALPELQSGTIGGRRVVVFRGEGGRDLLEHALTARGAEVSAVICYRRSWLAGSVALLQQAWESATLDGLVLTSSQGLRDLHRALAQTRSEMLKRTPVFVPHERILETGKSLGIRHIVRTAPGDAGVLAALCAYNWRQS